VPSVNRQKISEGGYLVIFMNDRKVYTLFFWADQGTGSPYILMNRRMTNNNKDDNPILIKILFRLVSSHPKNGPTPKPVSIIPSHGIGGYPIMKVFTGLIVMAVGPNNGVSTCLITEPSAKETRGNRFCKKIMDRPIMPIILGGRGSSSPSMMNPKPIVAITRKVNK